MNACRAAPGFLQASFDAARGEQKRHRKSLPLLDTPTHTTTLYFTSTAELRGDQDIYMLGIDKCYTTLEQANARVEMLGSCNVNERTVETKLMHTDARTGCMGVTLGRYGAQVRFVAHAKKMQMAGKVAQDDTGETSPGAWDKDDVGLFFAETLLDIAGHVWVVAIHKPGLYTTEEGHSRRHSLSLSHGRLSSMSGRSGRSSNATKVLKEERRSLGWTIDSMHVDSEKALNRAKRAWNEHFRSSHGRCKKIREHYGFARYGFKPTTVGKGDADYETCVQIRVERVRVVPKGEMVSEYLEAQAVEMSRRSFVPFMLPLKNNQDVGRAFEGRLISTSTGERSSFVDGLQKIADDMLRDGYDYDELPLALKIRHEHLLRVGDALPDQRYGGEERTRDSTADLYHALLRDLDMLNPPKRKAKGKTPTQAFVQARKRMIAALDETNALYEQTEKAEEGTAKAQEVMAKATTPSEATSPAPVKAPSIAQNENEKVACADSKQLPLRSATMRKRPTFSAKDSVMGKEEVLAAKDAEKPSQAPARRLRHTKGILKY
ncbi:hypothetical protein LTR85_000469 [Meristemomyces frigidus]|nr:hypothetical protein LTR85_000469 [Meristemomyces frigidus]